MNINKIDIGRLIAVSIFTFFMTLNILLVHRDISILSPINMTKTLGLIHHLLVVCFYALIILFYFLRSTASSTSRSFVTNTIAVLTTFSPSALSLLSEAELSRPEIVFLADFMIVLGMILSIFSLASLGRSFSIIPQARKLVKSGPYRLVRHPIYVGELNWPIRCRSGRDFNLKNGHILFDCRMPDLPSHSRRKTSYRGIPRL